MCAFGREPVVRTGALRPGIPRLGSRYHHLRTRSGRRDAAEPELFGELALLPARLRVGMPAHSAPVRCLLVHDGVLWSGATDGTVQQWSVEQFLSGKGS